jgi:mannose-6-phosphate isomerase-like protein (cupin superfamily)
VLVQDSTVEPITSDLAPGLAAHEVWKTEGTATVPVSTPPADVTAYYPPVNGVRFQVLTIPPDGAAAVPEDVDVAAELARLERVAPGMMAGDDPDDPGMHATDSVDYVYVASGTVWLDLADGETVELRAGDTVVQQGTRHAWRNRGDEPCVLVGTLVGALRTN